MQNLFKFPAKTQRTHLVEKVKEEVLLNTPVDEENIIPIWLAGRVVGILDEGVRSPGSLTARNSNPSGRLGFVLQDGSGRIDLVWDKSVNVGDIIEAGIHIKHGLDINKKKVVFFQSDEVNILAPCQEDFFIKKEDPNYRKMIIDLSLQERIKTRMQLIQKIREFFLSRDFIEMETPSLVRLPGMEPYLDVFKTEFVPQEGASGVQAKAEPMYLITSPEYALKKLLVSGFEKIFQICKSFRNKETASQLHNPEFTLIEWYRAYANYEEIMKDTEELVSFLAQQLVEENLFIQFQSHTINVSTPWPRLKVKDAFKQYADIQIVDFENIESFRKIVIQKGYKVDNNTSYDDLFFLVFMNEIEPKLGLDKPVILYEYPVSMAALSKRCADNPNYAERFEVYIAGVELCNAFTELNDPVEQEARLEHERLERQKLGKQDYPVDQSFVRALKCGMPPSSGIALGVDRLMMILTNTADIRDIIAFPHKDL